MRKETTSEWVNQAWLQFSCAATGGELPITAIEERGGLFLVVYECCKSAPPVLCLDGTAVRRLALSFEIQAEDVLWN